LSDRRSVRLGESRVPPLPVAGELFELYQPAIGHTATLLWLNLRWAAHAGAPFEISEWAATLGVSPKDVQAARERLHAYGLLEVSIDGELVVHDPLPREAFEVRFGEAGVFSGTSHALRAVGGQAEVPVGVSVPAFARPAESEREFDGDHGRSAPAPQQELPFAWVRSAPRVDEPKNGAPQPVLRSPLSKRRRNAHMLKLVEEKPGEQPPLNEDMQAVVQIYHKRIGMMGPTQYERLRFWVEEKGMEGAVVALAIEETVQSAEVPRISYLEGILRNWYNDGIRTLADIQRQKRASKVLSGGDSNGVHQGVPNASAYRTVDPELVAKWKEMYPDEYDA